MLELSTVHFILTVWVWASGRVLDLLRSRASSVLVFELELREG